MLASGKGRGHPKFEIVDCRFKPDLETAPRQNLHMSIAGKSPAQIYAK
jgi:hypothetical protein